VVEDHEDPPSPERSDEQAELEDHVVARRVKFLLANDHAIIRTEH